MKYLVGHTRGLRLATRGFRNIELTVSLVANIRRH